MKSHKRTLVLIVLLSASTSSMADLIVNGDFNNGNTGFTSGYTFASTNTGSSQYFIGTDPVLWNFRFDSFGDHTTGTGNMMMVNGSTIANRVVWSETVTVAQNTPYQFSGWVSSLLTYPNPARLQLFANDSQIGSDISASTTGGVWEPFSAQWNSGGSTSVTLEIFDTNLAITPNDFGLDDLSFTAIPIPAAVLLFASGLLGLVGVARRKNPT